MTKSSKVTQSKVKDILDRPDVLSVPLALMTTHPFRALLNSITAGYCTTQTRLIKYFPQMLISPYSNREIISCVMTENLTTFGKIFSFGIFGNNNLFFVKFYDVSKIYLGIINIWIYFYNSSWQPW